MWKKKDYLKTNNTSDNQKKMTSNLQVKDEEIKSCIQSLDENKFDSSSHINSINKIEVGNDRIIENAQVLNNESFNENIFSIEKNTDKTKLIMAKILKELRQNDEHLLQSVFQDFENAIIVENKLIVSFSGENYKDILEKTSNLTIINDIISSDGLIVEYKFETTKKEKTIDEILKEKFNKINIKE